MIYIFDNDFWHNGKEAIIKTEIGEVALRLENKSFMMKKRAIIYDRYHVEIGKIEKRSFKGGGQYLITYDTQLIATVEKTGFFFSRRYVIKTTDKQIFKIKGSIKTHKYQILKGKKSVATISPELAHRPHQYGMETSDDKRNRYAFLCSAVALTL